MKKTKLSVVLAVYNEEKNIKSCLISVYELADEIIIVDGLSTDKTVYQIKKFIKFAKKKKPHLKIKLFSVPNQKMFHKNKQLALEKATGDWILQLDADERVSKELRQEILKTIHQPSTINHQSLINGYFLPRKNYFLGRFLKKGGQYPDYVIRLIKKGKAYFPCQSVHEQIAIKGKVGYLKNPLFHFTAPTLEKYLANANRYTSLTAADLAKKNISLNFFNQLKYLFFLPIKTFFIIFIRHKGFIDGFPGFVFAFFSGLHFFIAFVKYWQIKKAQ